MRLPKVSVVIPVYSVEKYLASCLDSVCGQTLKNIEIICVNDCSQDNSLEIIQEYAKSDNRLKIIDFKENKGVGAARNAAIVAAQGQYIGFVDSDDWIEADFYEKLYSASNNTQFDIIKGADLYVEIGDKYKIYSQNDSIKQNKYNFYAQFTTAIYKTRFLKQNNIYFPENFKIYEDISFILQGVYYAKSINIIEDAIYHYVRHSGSLDTPVYDAATLTDFIRYVNWTLSFVENNDFIKSDKQILLSRLAAQISVVKQYKLECDLDGNILSELHKNVVLKKMRI